MPSSPARLPWLRLMLAALLLAILPLLWEVLVGLIAVAAGATSEDPLLLLALKAGFALLLAALYWSRGSWRANGFLGGPQFGVFWLLWPLWLGAAISATQIDPVRWSAGTILTWLACAFAVAFGEEGIFRGSIITTLRPFGRARAIIGSASLFGGAHLIGLATPLDPRMIAAQALFAFGLGLGLAAIRWRSGSIWPGVVAHTTLDFTGLMAANGLGAALSFSDGALAYWLGGSAVAILWGATLLIGSKTEPDGQGGERQRRDP